MNIVFVLPGLGFGGAERVVANLANSFAQQHTVSIVLSSSNTDSAYVLNDAIRVEAPSKEEGVLKTWLSVRRICQKIRPDAVLAFMTDTGSMTTLSLLGTGIPVIVSERNDPAVERKSVSASMRFIGKISSFFTKGYVFQSEGAKAYYPKRIQRKSCIILNPLEVDKLPKRESDKTDKRIVSVGRLCPQKNQQMLIRAFAASNAASTHSLHIYGEGPLRAELEELITQLGVGDRVFLEGNSSQVHEDIKNAKLFAFTSDYEGLPNALMEAMAIGVPCVSTDCSPGGARMLIENGANGLLIPCGDTEALTAVFDTLLEDEERLNMFSVNGQKLRKRVCAEEIANEWLECIGKVI